MTVDPRFIVYGPAVAYLLESVFFLLKPFQISRSISALLYPQLDTLIRYCSSNSCLFPPRTIASLYTVQLMTFLFFAFFMYFLGRSNRKAIDPASVGISAVVICAALVDYLVGNFSFDPIWLVPNPVATSSIGVFRYVLLFSVASICVAILANAVRPGVSKNASR